MNKFFYLIAFISIMAGCQIKETSQSDSNVATNAYNEPLRPQFHFSPELKWMNDPNGMVYYDGEYHLFYQYYPDSTVWGPMHWGHAVSTDMVHWQHLPVALYPDSLGYIFSGSAVMDPNNTSGFGSAENPAMIAIYTYHSPEIEKTGRIDYQTQGIAYSLDKGRTWTKYDGNPVIKNPGIRDFRDPKVSWNEEIQKWVMILAVKDHVSIYSSPDLKEWKFESDFGAEIGAHGGVWECPDLFTLTDEKGYERWVMLVSINPGGPNGGSATQYFIGDFDGKVFTPEDSVTRWMDYGTDNYAGVTWSDIPEEDGRRLLVGWMNNWQYATIIPTKEWRGAMTIPRELVLEGKTLKSVPVKELQAIRDKKLDFDISQDSWELISPLAEIDITLSPENQLPVELVLSNELNEQVVVRVENDKLLIDRRNSGITDFEPGFAKVHEAPLSERTETIKLFLDRSSIEVFVNGGSTTMTDLFFPNQTYNNISISEGKERVKAISGYSLNSIWKDDADIASASVED